jgi:hypothetical protein
MLFNNIFNSKPVQSAPAAMTKTEKIVAAINSPKGEQIVNAAAKVGIVAGGLTAVVNLVGAGINLYTQSKVASKVK